MSPRSGAGIQDGDAADDDVHATAMQDLVRQILAELGENPEREGLLATPRREKSLKFLTSVHGRHRIAHQPGPLPVDYSEMVIVKDIDFYSLCEHHLLPFFGTCHVAYLPRTKVIGLARSAHRRRFFRRLQVQERLTNEIASTIQDAIDPLGVGVVMEAPPLHGDAASRSSSRRP